MTDHISIVSDALALIVNVTGASRLPLGGGLGMAPGVATALDTALRQKILRRSATPIIVKAKLANDAGLIGASYL
ncbi:hypothetical protein AA0535_2907 [Asaia krungthepensis NRIC 0535]|uniref:Uncharacterized protein n=2 Tax=Asaia krungthepensis TaxID=220990 RepID=A0ABQ0Q6M6_9PROT|nr:hypothetical protein AA0535_2907 [Asaia krungthepensis NRIC 0535]